MSQLDTSISGTDEALAQWINDLGPIEFDRMEEHRWEREKANRMDFENSGEGLLARRQLRTVSQMRTE
jgi:hypothetical protein